MIPTIKNNNSALKNLNASPYLYSAQTYDDEYIIIRPNIDIIITDINNIKSYFLIVSLSFFKSTLHKLRQLD